jgi:putative hydrolase of the HAD superfamily
MIKTIIFDADGMVLKRGVLPSDKIAKEFNITIEKLSVFFKNEFQLCKVGKADIKKILKNYLPSWGWNKSTDEFLDYWFKFDSNLNQEMLASIKELRSRGIRCYLATNNEKYRTEYFKNVLNFKNIFDGIFSTCNIGYSKSQQKFWQKVHELLENPNKKEVLCWDNDEKNVKAAKDFGFSAELYTGFDNYKNKINDYITKK